MHYEICVACSYALLAVKIASILKGLRAEEVDNMLNTKIFSYFWRPTLNHIGASKFFFTLAGLHLLSWNPVLQRYIAE